MISRVIEGRRFGVFIVNSEQILYILMFPLLTLNK